MARHMRTNAESRRNSPGVIVPPPLIYAGTLTVGILIDRFATGLSTSVGTTPRYALAILPIGIGAFLTATALGLFRKARTRPEPWQPASALVTDGIYRFTRNPMYLGMALVYAGLALALDSPVSLLLLFPLIAVIQCSVIAREERYLAEKFGDAYRHYKEQVRRWL